MATNLSIDNPTRDVKAPDNESQQNLTFHVDAGKTASYNSNRLGITSDISNSVTDVKDFLSRPVFVNSYTWSTASTPSTDIFSFYPSDVLVANTMYNNKLLGFRFLRATINIKIEVTPTPFQAGAFILAWLPFPQMQAADRVVMHNKLIPFSQLPNVLYTTQDNSVEISFPFVGPTDAWDRTYPTTSWDFGSVKAKVYSQLVGGADNSNLNLNVYMWLTEIHLSGLVPQSGVIVKRSRRPKNVIPSESEVNEGKGTVSALFDTGSTFASAAGDIPLFSAVAKPAAWVLASLAKATSAFGWSKPDVGASGEMKFVTRTSDAYGTNCSGTDASVNLNAMPGAFITPHRMLSPLPLMKCLLIL